MENRSVKLRNTGFAAFFISGLCAMSSGVIVSLLQERLKFDYAMTGILLALMNIGNLTASFATGVLPTKIGTKKTTLILCCGYFLGYGVMSFNIGIVIAGAAFLLLGVAKGCVINNCTILVGNNTDDKTKGMNVMHACYACGALLGPVFITIALLFNNVFPFIFLAAAGLILWLIFVFVKLPETNKTNKNIVNKEWDFLKNKLFWLLTGLIFCQNAAETSVTGWLVTYYKSTGILSKVMSNYTVTIMWGATLVARLVIAFVIPVKNKFKALALMGGFSTVLYAFLIFADNGIMAVIMLAAFSFAMAGVNPTAVAGAGNMLNPKSVGIMLPVAGLGAILMPFIIGIVADIFGMSIGMFVNIIPCFGIIVFSILCKKNKKQ